MNYFESFILGIVQGLTEFLPISSSGHLVIFQHIFGITSDNIAFEVMVHAGTLLSVLAVYYADVWRMIVSFFRGIFRLRKAQPSQNDSYFRLSVFVIVATMPAVIFGLTLNDFFEQIFHNVFLVGITLTITGLILLSTRWVKTEGRQLTFGKSLLIGGAQAVAILPGISRSGSTISGGLWCGLDRMEATRFSFLLSVPAILGALILHLKDLIGMAINPDMVGMLVIGFLTSFIVGYIAIRFLLRVVQSDKFSWFGFYCIIVGVAAVFFLK
ncbi:MAG TPA: undecaprenyl-diphosphatase UppP [Candidatus Marinimicrobia bacterium]|nr:undecaprenyl-diphosphatase UppP [Candidatus Neomarinimicrobiota bacterium]HRS51052.1 undecaprenyl-diphosphatase UppP [Candidatus Neomarinimicrobiota bacterium]HRU92559.1 undecaprenyl-diphosphatase UppP [Candidatus Neomarinimicrobiota bacterium]